MAWLLAILVAIGQVAGPNLCRCPTFVCRPPASAATSPKCPRCVNPLAPPVPADAPEPPRGPRPCRETDTLTATRAEPSLDPESVAGPARGLTIDGPAWAATTVQPVPRSSPHPFFTAAMKLCGHHVLRC